ncbi:MAG: hypothetical protein ACI8UO_005865 [Verrucomicrobiales bacterium]|jgi:hypothetical protein
MPNPEKEQPPLEFPHSIVIQTQFADVVNAAVKDSMVQLRFGAVIPNSSPLFAQEGVRIAMEPILAKNLVDMLAASLDHYPVEKKAPAKKKSAAKKRASRKPASS